MSCCQRGPRALIDSADDAGTPCPLPARPCGAPTHTVHVHKLGKLGLDERHVLDKPRLAVRLLDRDLADLDIVLARELLAGRLVGKLPRVVVDLDGELGLDDVAQEVQADGHAREVLAHPRAGVDNAAAHAARRALLHAPVPHEGHVLAVQLAEVVDHLLAVPTHVVLCDAVPVPVLALVEEVGRARVREHGTGVAVGQLGLPLVEGGAVHEVDEPRLEGEGDAVRLGDAARRGGDVRRHGRVDEGRAAQRRLGDVFPQVVAALAAGQEGEGDEQGDAGEDGELEGADAHTQPARHAAWAPGVDGGVGRRHGGRCKGGR